MSIDRPIHDGRKKDPWQIPHKNRTRWTIWFHFRNGEKLGRVIAVPEPSDINIKKYRDEVIALNYDDWFRPVFKPVAYDPCGNPIKFEPVMDKLTGKQLRKSRLLKVTADFMGADI